MNEKVYFGIGIAASVVALIVLQLFGITTGLVVNKTYEKEFLSCKADLGSSELKLAACTDYVKTQESLRCKESVWGFIGMGVVGILGLVLIFSMIKVLGKDFFDKVRNNFIKKDEPLKKAKSK